MTAPAFIYTSEPWAALSFGAAHFRPSVHAGANECGSFAPILFRLPLRRRVLWILTLDPVPRPAGAVGGAKALRYADRSASFLIAFTQYLFDSLHDWHLKILLITAIITHLAHIFFQCLQINYSVIAFGIVVTAEPRGDEPRLTDFVMHELVTVDFRNVDRHLGLDRPGGCKGKDGYQGDADALP
jgi:hypothetical protein